ncbi:hypothetical protein Tco_1327401 [Tanacetum coccineum]
MQQFWYTIKKVQGTDSYEFLLANKKCRVDAEVFRNILDMCLRVEGEEFIAEIVDVSEESEPAKKKTGSRSSRGVVTQDTPSAPKTKPAASKPKLKGVQSLTPEEQEAADTMQAFKERKKTNRRQPSTKGSIKGTGRIPGVPDESIMVSATSSEGTGTILGVPDEEKVTSKEKVILERKEESDKSIDLEMTDDEETDDEFVQGVEQVNDDEDEEITNAEVEVSRNGDEENTDAAKTDAGKTEEVYDDAKRAELHPTSSILSLSLVAVISEHVVPTPIPVIPSVAPATSLLTPLSVSTIPPLRVAKFEKDVSELKKIDHSTKALATFKSQVPKVVEQYLGSKIGDDLQKVLQRHTVDLIQKYFVKPATESSKI